MFTHVHLHAKETTCSFSVHFKTNHFPLLCFPLLSSYFSRPLFSFSPLPISRLVVCPTRSLPLPRKLLASLHSPHLQPYPVLGRLGVVQNPKQSYPLASINPLFHPGFEHLNQTSPQGRLCSVLGRIRSPTHPSLSPRPCAVCALNLRRHTRKISKQGIREKKGG